MFGLQGREAINPLIFLTSSMATTTDNELTGTKSFPTLTAMPFDRHPSMESLREKLIKRGAKVESFAGTHYCTYTGIAWRLDERDKMVKFSVKGRVVLDAYGWDQFNPNSAVILSPL